mgnify:CR=1 FL=1|jgi:hypothetical protein|nr:MAG TPA: Trm112p-like protein [Caudoviricetes sp.]
MRCPSCYKEVGEMKKNQFLKCRCGAKLLAVEINKKLEVFDLSKDEEEM